MAGIRDSVRDVFSTAALILMVRNWPQALSAIRSRCEEYPPLHLRRGITIEGLPHERPFQWFGPIFRDREYRRHIAEPFTGTMIDIGANIGAATLDWLSRIPAVKVHAYEPDPRTFAFLTHNIRSNRYEERVQLYNEAVSAALGARQFYRVGASTATTAFPDARDARESFTVQTVDLSKVVDRCGAGQFLPLVKIDAEGAEAEILEAAPSKTIKKIHQLIIECHDRFVPNAEARCIKVLEANGFRCIVHPTSDQFSLLYAIAISS
jgi:FkbM family methyltransferase